MEFLIGGFVFGVAVIVFLWFPYDFKLPKKTGDAYKDYGYPYD